MVRTKMATYKCPRCGYENNLKSKMKRHFESKLVCPSVLSNIELTEEIRDDVLTNRRHQPAKDPITQKVTNFNILANFVDRMDFDTKFDRLLTFQAKEPLEFGEQLDNDLNKRRLRLTDNSFRSAYTLEEQDFLTLVDKLTRVDKEQLERLNVLFDKKLKRIKIFNYGEWSTYLEEQGVIELISLIKSYYLNDYELYLIRNIHGDRSNIANKFVLKEHLEIYYKFLAQFNLPIHIFGMTDREILGHRLVDNNEYYLDDYYTSSYEKIKSSISGPEKNKISKKILKVVKDNTVHNMAELNRKLLDLLNINEEFKREILSDKK